MLRSFAFRRMLTIFGWSRILLVFLWQSYIQAYRHPHHHKLKIQTADQHNIAPTPTQPTTRTAPSKGLAHYKTTESILLKVGNKTINTNLQTALDDIAPGQQTSNFTDAVTKANLRPDSHDENYAFKQSTLDNKNASNKNTSNVILEVIDIVPIFQHQRYRVKLIIVSSLYAVLGLAIIFVSYCLARIIISKKKRHKQYMLLTKRDLEFPLGGGGI